MVHGAIRIRKCLGDATGQIITAELSQNYKLIAALFKEQKDSLMIEAKDQSEVVYISVIKGFCSTTAFNNYGILYMLRKTELTVYKDSMWIFLQWWEPLAHTFNMYNLEGIADQSDFSFKKHNCL